MPVDAETFRDVLGSIPAGVSVVTTVAGDGTPRGLTSTAVCSVSLEPPILLVCVDKTSTTLPALRHTRAFVVNVLADGREARSRQFATKDPEKFRDVPWEPSEIAGGAPILVEDCTAYAECLVFEELEVGDHIVFLASIEAGTPVPGRAPLVFLRGSYRGWPSDSGGAAAGGGRDGGTIERVGNVFYAVDDMQAAVGFYRDLLGLRLTVQDGDRWAAFDVGGTTLALVAGETGNRGSGATVSLRVADVEAWRREAVARGVTAGEIGVGPHERTVAVTDPAGNRLLLYSPLPPAA